MRTKRDWEARSIYHSQRQALLSQGAGQAAGLMDQGAPQALGHRQTELSSLLPESTLVFDSRVKVSCSLTTHLLLRVTRC